MKKLLSDVYHKKFDSKKNLGNFNFKTEKKPT